jgi:hypothetical protein
MTASPFQRILSVVFGLSLILGPCSRADEQPFEVFTKMEVLQRALRDDANSVKLASLLQALREADLETRESSAYRDVFQRACQLAGKEDIAALVDIFAAYPAEDFGKGDLFCPLAGRWLELHCPERFSPMPPPISEDIQEKVSNQTSDDQPENRIAYEFHRKEYWETVTRLLRGDIKAGSEELPHYVWGSWCGTGSDSFYKPHTLATIIAAVSENKWSEAIPFILNATKISSPNAIARVLIVGVPNPVQTVLDRLSYINKQPTDDRSAINTQALLAILLRIPDESRVKKLIEFLPTTPMTARSDYFAALAKFVPTGASYESDATFGESWGGNSLDQVEAVPVNADEARIALQALCAQASPDLGVDAAQALAQIFENKRQLESIPALHKLLDHPSALVASSAQKALKNLGEEAVVPPKLGDVRYAITINDKPLSHTQIQWAFEKANGNLSSTTSTNKDGILALSRSYFLKTEPTISKIALCSQKIEGPDTPFFVTLLTPPPASDDIIPVNIITSPVSLTVTLPQRAEEFALQEMDITLWGGQSPEAQGIAFYEPSKFRIPVQDHIRFAALAPGVYRLEIRLPGATSWMGTIDTTDKSMPEISLERASDVRMKVEVPVRWSSNLIFPQLYQDGKLVNADYDYDKKAFRGVKPGRYVLRFPSSKETRKKVLGVLPDAPEFEASETPFEVKSNSPIEIDLGTIRITSTDRR